MSLQQHNGPTSSWPYDHACMVAWIGPVKYWYFGLYQIWIGVCFNPGFGLHLNSHSLSVSVLRDQSTSMSFPRLLTHLREGQHLWESLVSSSDGGRSFSLHWRPLSDPCTSLLAHSWYLSQQLCYSSIYGCVKTESCKACCTQNE